MHFSRGGYTIIEVIIVLAVSSALFFAAVTVFSGKQGGAQFTQAMQDLDSQIRNYVNDVSVSLYPEAGQYSCAVSGGLPTLTSGSTSGVATSGDCIFLGKAFQADTNSGVGKIYVYSVLGTRLNNGGSPVTNFTEARPSPASTSAGMLPPEIYTLEADTNIRSSRVGDSISDTPASAVRADMIGFYNNLQSTSTAGRQTVLAYGYNGFATQPTFTNNVKSTIENPAAASPIQIWYLCLESGSSNQTAQLAIVTTPAGITTKLEYIACN